MNSVIDVTHRAGASSTPICRVINGLAKDNPGVAERAHLARRVGQLSRIFNSCGPSAPKLNLPQRQRVLRDSD